MVHGSGVVLELGIEVAVMIPGGMYDVDEAYAAFDHSSGQQAIAGKVLVGFAALFLFPRFPWVPVGLTRRLPRWRVIPWIDRSIRGRDLHPPGQFVGGDAGSDLGIVNLLISSSIDSIQGGQSFLLEEGGQSLGVIQVEHRFSLGTKEDARIVGGKETALPERGPSAGSAACVEHGVAGEVAGMATQTVGDPGAHGRHAEAGYSALHLKLAGVVVEFLRMHRTDHKDIVRHGTEVRYEVAELHSGLPVFPEGPLGSHKGCSGRFDKGEAGFVEHAFGKALACHFVELWLGVEEIDLGGSSGHENEDACLGLGVEMRLARGHRVPESSFVGIRQQAFLGQKGSEGNSTDPGGGSGKEISAGAEQMVLDGIHDDDRYSLVRNSSMLSMMRTVAVQAAVSGSPAKDLASSGFFSYQDRESASRSEKAFVSCGSGERETQRRKPWAMRFSSPGGASFKMRWAKALAASTKVTLLSVTRAARGVLERLRFTHATLESGQSKVSRLGCGEVRLKKV